MRRAERGANQIRIIGGTFRGRKLAFPDVTGLRPTPDRVRETLFNWLQGQVEGARCLDLFAGSGALGFEALSRGAGYVQFVDNSPAVKNALRVNVEKLGCVGRAHVSQMKAEGFLNEKPTRPSPSPFDLVLLDPPYALDQLVRITRQINTGQWLNSRGFIYVEQDAHDEPVALPENWQLAGEGKAGQVAFRLLQVAPRQYTV